MKGKGWTFHHAALSYDEDAREASAFSRQAGRRFTFHLFSAAEKIFQKSGDAV
ncbi:MAG: hypothetical protein ACOY4H_15295 [Thermodesulfobacteriota bacterium]